jgi:hypothetical protein
MKMQGLESGNNDSMSYVNGAAGGIGRLEEDVKPKVEVEGSEGKSTLDLFGADSPPPPPTAKLEDEDEIEGKGDSKAHLRSYTLSGSGDQSPSSALASSSSMTPKTRPSSPSSRQPSSRPTLHSRQSRKKSPPPPPR